MRKVGDHEVARFELTDRQVQESIRRVPLKELVNMLCVAVRRSEMYDVYSVAQSKWRRERA